MECVLLELVRCYHGVWECGPFIAVCIAFVWVVLILIISNIIISMITTSG